MTNTVLLDNNVVSFSLDPAQAHSLYCVLQNASAWQDTDSPALDDLRDQLRDILSHIRYSDVFGN